MSETGTPTHARHRLAWLDQLAFELFRATGRSQLMQCLWLYDREVNLDILAQTCERLAALPFNRLIEPSRLPWGRPRWVKPAIQPELIQQIGVVLPRAQLMHWANQHARMTVDPVTGPAWRMALQRFDDGCTAVSIVGSHLVIDGMGGVRAIEAAAKGVELPNDYITQGTRGWLAGCVSDARQVLEDAPRIIAALASLARAGWRGLSSPFQGQALPAPGSNFDRQAKVELPAVAMTIDAHAWDSCAARLGGWPSTLLPGLVAVLAARLGRCRTADGAVSLLVPINRRRGLNDERALAIDFRTMTVAPAGLSSNLGSVNASLEALLRGAKQKQPDPLAPILPAISWMPRSAAARFLNRLFSYAEALPVSCSYLGALPDAFACIDGARSTRVLARAVDQNVTRGDLERSRGHLVVVASRFGNSVSLCAEACQIEPALTTRHDLRMACLQTLTDFGLDADIEP